MKTRSSSNVTPFTHANRVPLATLAALLLLGGCAVGGAKIVGPSDAATPGTPGQPGTPTALAEIVLTSPASQVAALASLPLHATALDAAGDTLSAVFSWNSSDPSVATVDATGLVTGVGPGRTNITAAADSVTSGAFQLTVTPAPVATITVTAPSSSMASLSTMQALAVARDASGKVVSGVTFSWVSTNTSAATVSSSGLITAGLVGSTEIQAMAGGISSNGLTVNVAP